MIYIKFQHCTFEMDVSANTCRVFKLRFCELVKSATEMSQAAACDGTPITTTAVGQDIAPGTLPTF